MRKNAQPPAVKAAAWPIDDAAAYLGVSRASVYRLIRSGQLAKTTVLGRTLIRRIDADALLARCARTTGAEAA